MDEDNRVTDAFVSKRADGRGHRKPGGIRQMARDAGVPEATFRRRRRMQQSVRMPSRAEERVREVVQADASPVVRQEVADAAYRAELQAQLERAKVAELSYRAMIDAQAKHLTRAEFMKIVWCLHPDQNPAQEQKAEAYGLLMAQEIVLCGKAPAIQIMGDGTSPWDDMPMARSRRRPTGQ